MIVCTLDGQTSNEELEDFNSFGRNKKIHMLRSEIGTNETRFSKINLVEIGQFRRTTDPYGPLYLIVDKHEKRYYRLDLVGQDCSSEFIKVYLESPKLKSIYRMTKKSEKSLYGEFGQNGVVVMRFKNLRGIKTEHCGFQMIDKDHGDNYTIFTN